MIKKYRFQKIYKQVEIDHIIIFIMVSIYPLLTIQGITQNSNGPRFIFLAFISLFAFIYNIYNNVQIKKPANYFLFAFLLFACLATIFSDNSMLSWGGDPRRFTGLATYICCAILFLTANSINDPEKIIKSMVYFSAVVSAIAVAQHFGYDILSMEYTQAGLKSAGTLGNSNFLGSYVVLVLPASAMLFLKKHNFRWLFTTGLLFAALLSSMTRGSWLAFGLILIILSIQIVHKNKPLWKRWIIIVVVLLFIYLAFSISNEQVVVERTATIFTEAESVIELDDKAGSGRIFIWRETTKLILDNWYFGVGPDNLKFMYSTNLVVDKAHNHILEIMVTMGLFAFISYIVFLFYCFKGRRSDWLGNSMMLMIIAYLIQAQFNIDVVANLPLYWIILGLMQSSICNHETMSLKTKTLLVDKKLLPIEAFRNKYFITAVTIIITIFIIYISIIVFVTREDVIAIEGQGVYTGQVRSFMFHGYGIWKMDNGSVYEGEFKNGLYDGFGTITYANGSKYVGEFKEGYFHGAGKIITGDGRIVEGTWVRGIKIE